MGLLINKLIVVLFTGSFFVSALPGSTSVEVRTGKSIIGEVKNKYQLFYFWATWCPDCKEKLASDLSVYTKGSVDLFTLSIEKDLERVRDYTLENKVKYPVYFDENKELQKAFKIFSVPTVVLAERVGGEFKVIKQVSGKDWSEIESFLSKSNAKSL